MLDKKKEQMLNIAMLLTANELDEIHESDRVAAVSFVAVDVEDAEDDIAESAQESSGVPEVDGESSADTSGLTAGQRERLRTRESKISTACVGQARESHEWWPIGTELEGRIGREVFCASVVANPQVKSGRSILIDSGPAQGRVCITPTRAAIEATEAYRQLVKMGRGGGVTNGWSFWKPKK